MAGALYTYVGNSEPSNRTGAILTSQGTVLKGSSGLFLTGEYASAVGMGLLLSAGPAISPWSQLAAPVVAAGGAGVLTGTFRYVWTFVTAAGETVASPETSITLASQQASLTNAPIGSALSGVTARKLYRTAANGASGSEKLVTTLNDNATTTYTDNTADGSLGAVVPTSDTAGVLSSGGSAPSPQTNYAIVGSDGRAGGPGGTPLALSVTNAAGLTVNVGAASGGDDTTSLQAIFSALTANQTLKLTSGQTYKVSASLILPSVSDLTIDLNGATIQATAAIAAAGIIDSSKTAQLIRPTVRNGVLDCNNNADDGLFLRYFAHATVKDLVVLKFNANAHVFGDLTATSNSFEAMLDGANSNRGSTDAVPVGSRGIWMQNCSDAEVTKCVLVGADIGIRNDGADNKFSHCHAWGYTGHNPSVCFDDNQGGMYANCTADTPTTFGYRIRTNNGTLISGGSVVNGTFGGSDNVLIGVQVDPTSPNFSIQGVSFIGADVTHRLAKAVVWSTSTGGRYMIAGCRYNNVVTFPNEAWIFQSTSTGFQVQNGSASPYFVAQGGNKSMQLWNGGKLLGYTDNGATQTLGVDGATGAVQPGGAAGVGVRIFSGAGAPTTPGGAITYVIGDIYLRTDGGVGTTVYRCTAATPTWAAIL